MRNSASFPGYSKRKTYLIRFRRRLSCLKDSFAPRISTTFSGILVAPQFALKRTLGAFNVTLIGVGAIIGAGIFATVGSAAAGDAVAGRPGAGLTYVVVRHH